MRTDVKSLFESLSNNDKKRIVEMMKRLNEEMNWNKFYSSNTSLDYCDLGGTPNPYWDAATAIYEEMYWTDMEEWCDMESDLWRSIFPNQDAQDDWWDSCKWPTENQELSIIEFLLRDYLMDELAKYDAQIVLDQDRDGYEVKCGYFEDVPTSVWTRMWADYITACIRFGQLKLNTDYPLSPELTRRGDEILKGSGII